MPFQIDHIDAISRRKQRGVLCVTFHPNNWGDWDDQSWKGYDYHDDTRRAEVISWLDEQGFIWKECGPFASERGFRKYLGEIYLDVPFDESDPQYKTICNHLENPDGSMRHEQVRFLSPLGNRHKKCPS
jgi:hypothetical protein